MHKQFLVLSGLAVLLASCSSTSPDKRLRISGVTVITEYQAQDNSFVGCNTVEGLPSPDNTQTQVRVTVQTEGALGALAVALQGQTTPASSAGFSTTINSDNTTNFRAYGNNKYAVVFTADSSTSGQMLPYSVGRAKPQGITVTPNIENVKRVSVDPSNRVNAQGGGGRFLASVTGTSDQGSQTAAVNSGININVYQVCTFVSNTGTSLLDY